jgi:hypothetical protein
LIKIETEFGGRLSHASADGCINIELTAGDSRHRSHADSGEFGHVPKRRF